MISTSFLVYLVAVVLLTITMLLVSHLLNPKTPKRVNNFPFESGIVPQGTTDIRWNVNYFLVAISFVIFDIEAVFLCIWSIVVMETGWHGFFVTSFFIFALLIALFYEVKQGAFLWGVKQNTSSEELKKNTINEEVKQNPSGEDLPKQETKPRLKQVKHRPLHKNNKQLAFTEKVEPRAFKEQGV